MHMEDHCTATAVVSLQVVLRGVPRQRKHVVTVALRRMLLYRFVLVRYLFLVLL